jgi:YVTN family beta-propeller protein
MMAVAPGMAAEAGPECAAVRSLLPAHVDRALEREEQERAEQHLAACAACRAALAHYEEIERQLARLRGRGPASPITYDVLAALRGDRPDAWRGRALRLAVIALLVLAMAAVGVIAARAIAMRGSARPLVDATGYLYVLRLGDDKVAVVDVEQAKVTDVIDLSFEPSQIVTSADGRLAYVLGERQYLATIDIASKTVASTWAIAGGANGLALSPDGKVAYVSLLDRRSVAMLDLASGEMTAQARVGRNPADLAVTPDGRWLYVMNEGDATVSKVRAGSDRETRVLTLLRSAGQSSTNAALAMSRDGRMLYVADLGREAVWAVDVQSDQVRPVSVPMRGTIVDMQVAPDNARLLLVHNDQRSTSAAQSGLTTLALPKVERTASIQGTLGGVASAPDGSLLFVTSPRADQVVYLDAQTLEIKLAVAVGSGPAGLVFVPEVQ